MRIALPTIFVKCTIFSHNPFAHGDSEGDTCGLIPKASQNFWIASDVNSLSECILLGGPPYVLHHFNNPFMMFSCAQNLSFPYCEYTSFHTFHIFQRFDRSRMRFGCQKTNKIWSDSNKILLMFDKFNSCSNWAHFVSPSHLKIKPK